jgi:hypothetical protein
MDGYPDGHGLDLANFLKDITLVNGISCNEKRKIANGMGCLAAQCIAHLKDGPGSIYVYPINSRDCGEEYIYTIEEMVQGKITLTCFDVYDNKVLFSGSASDFIKKFDPNAEKKTGYPEKLSVSSKWIDNFIYEDGCLVMKTKAGKYYEYKVTDTQWNELKRVAYSGESVGAYFNKFIK